MRTGTPDALTWKFEENGEYSASWAYHTQFIGVTRNDFETIIWKPWVPPKCKFFSWLAIQNRIWTADRLEARNWSNQRICPLCRIPTKHLWSEITVWTATPNLHPNAWPPSDTLENWWMAISAAPSASRRGLCSIIILVCWEVWTERNARVFQHVESPNLAVLQKIKR